MSAKEIETLNQFKIVDKPEESNFPNRAKYRDLLLALKNLAADKSIYLSKEEMARTGFALKIATLRQALKSGSKRLGFQANAIEKNGGFYFFNK